MKNAIVLMVMLVIGIFGIVGVSAYDADTPYTVTMNFIVGEDTTFTVELAGAETTIDFNPATKDSKEVEPDSQADGTPIVNITNAGNTNLDFTHKVNDTLPTGISVCYDGSYAANWAQILGTGYTSIDTSVAAGSSTGLYMWANFTDVAAGTQNREYQINSTAS